MSKDSPSSASAGSEAGSFCDFQALRDGMAHGRWTAVELFEAAVARANARKDLHAFVSVAEKVDIEQIKSAASKPLNGIPIAVKDIIDVTGFPCTGGTPALREWYPSRDATAVARLKAAGAVVMGKANLHELSAGITSNNPTFGAVRNPYDLSLIGGGSSGGSAAAVAAGIVPASLGGDTAGSNRIPASLCGCVGFRPSVGRYPSDGLIPLSFTRDTIGIFARRVGDVRTLDAIISGETLSAKSNGLKGRRLGVPRAYFYDNLDPGTRDVTEVALRKLADAGAELIETEVANVADLSNPISLDLIFYETVRDMSMYLASHRAPVHAWEVVDKMASATERGWLEDQVWKNPTSTRTYNKILEQDRPAVRAAYENCFKKDRLDALVLPTTPLPARPAGHDETVELNGEQVSTLATYIRNVDPTAVVGMTSISVPGGLTKDGLPVGISFDGLAGTDGDILAIAEAFEAICDPLPLPTFKAAKAGTG